MVCSRCKKLLLSNTEKRTKTLKCALHMWTSSWFAKDVESHLREQIEIVIIGHISVELVFV